MLRVLSIVLVSLVLVYVGTAGWAKLSLVRDEAALVRQLPTSQPSGPPVIYQGVQLRDAKTLKQLLDQELASSFWPWIQYLPANASMLLLAFGFGGFGGSSSLVAKHQLKRQRFEVSTGLRTVAFGSVLGLMLGLLSFLLPQIFTVQENVILRPEAVAATCFFGGVFQESTYVWIEKRFQNYFGSLAPPTTVPDAAQSPIEEGR